ncbi:MAG: hypothetical protein N3E51_03350 [Candidatus Micrarchaeota archaeon]|nr:hypothetical protein [Candidatus Micrarchaeota archaeon]
MDNKQAEEVGLKRLVLGGLAARAMAGFMEYAEKIRQNAGTVLFALVSIFILYSSSAFLSKLQQIPSPLYGGDYYNGLGGVIHIVDGGNPLESAQMAGQVPWVPWLYHLCVAIFAKISSLPPMRALIDFALVIDVLSLVAVYLVVREFSKNPYLPAVFALLYFSLGHHPSFKYSSFSFLVIMPFFGLALFRFAKEPSLGRAALAGVFLGLAALSNTQAFFAAFLLFSCCALLFLAPRLASFKPLRLNPDRQSLAAAKLWAVVFMLGFAISLLFWFKPIFVYRGNTPNDIQNITTPDVRNPAILWSSIQSYVFLVLLPFQSGYLWIFSLLSLAGIYHAYGHRGETESKFALAVLVAWLFAIIHPIFTLPLLQMHFVNFMLSDQIYPFAVLVLLSIGADAIFQYAKGKGALLPPAILAALFLAAFLSYTGYMQARQDDQWSRVGMTPLSPPFVELSDWIRSNTDVNDVFLTNNEEGFAMNALSGRKVVAYRRTHASPYVNMNERMADVAVMAYGTNDAVRLSLLDKYGVRYLLWSANWVRNEFSFDSNGQLVGFFDPLSIPANSTNRRYWDENGVKYIEYAFPMDPAPRQGVPVYNQLVALPANFSSQPLSPQIYSHFTLVKTISADGQDIFRIYERKK